MRTVSVRQCLKGIAHISDSHFELSSGSTNVDGVVSLRLALRKAQLIKPIDSLATQDLFARGVFEHNSFFERNFTTLQGYKLRILRPVICKVPQARCLLHMKLKKAASKVADSWSQGLSIQQLQFLRGSCRCDPVTTHTKAPKWARRSGNPERSCQAFGKALTQEIGQTWLES